VPLEGRGVHRHIQPARDLLHGQEPSAPAKDRVDRIVLGARLLDELPRLSDVVEGPGDGRADRPGDGRGERVTDLPPSCLPATVNGGQGTPPASRSTPAYLAGSQTSTLATSPLATFQCGRLCLSVLHAFASSSTASSWQNPASSRPSDCPPAPAQISTTVCTRPSRCLVTPWRPVTSPIVSHRAVWMAEPGSRVPTAGPARTLAGKTAGHAPFWAPLPGGFLTLSVSPAYPARYDPVTTL
jgi:hypothetical protein